MIRRRHRRRQPSIHAEMPPPSAAPAGSTCRADRGWSNKSRNARLRTTFTASIVGRSILHRHRSQHRRPVHRIRQSAECCPEHAASASEAGDTRGDPSIKFQHRSAIVGTIAKPAPPNFSPPPFTQSVPVNRASTFFESKYCSAIPRAAARMPRIILRDHIQRLGRLIHRLIRKQAPAPSAATGRIRSPASPPAGRWQDRPHCGR